jgi:hypothetical protein
VVLTYLPSTGDTLNPSGLNDNLYSQTAGRSLIETANGHIEYTNLKSDFQVQSHLIRPGQTGFAGSAGRLFSADYFSDLWAGPSAAGYIPVGGAALTKRVPYNCTLALFSASVFITCWRQFGMPAGAAYTARVTAPDIRIQTFIGNNQGLTYTRRELPQTVFRDATAATVVSPISTTEARTCHQFNLRHFKHVGGTDPNDALTRGWVTFGISLLIPQNLVGQDTTNTFNDLQLQLNSATSPDARPSTFYSGIHRVRMYVRSATIVPFL